MFYSNLNDKHGHIEQSLATAFNETTILRIAVGYVATDTIERYAHTHFFRLAERGGLVQILVGMAFFDGLNAKKKNKLENIDHHLREINDSCGIFIPCFSRYHGKIYSTLNRNDDFEIYIGSHNFSSNAFNLNLEASIKVQDRNTQFEINEFLDYIFSHEETVHINDVDVPIKGKPAPTDVQLTRAPIPFDKDVLLTAPFFDIDLAERSTQPESNLNIYFGTGRDPKKKGGKIQPRPWYELEIICPAATNRLDQYPKGEFVLYTSDGFCLPMKTSSESSGFKNFRSTGPKRSGALQILGLWLKGKLENAGALQQYQPVTPETFEIYGKSIMRIYKIEDGVYYTDF